MRTTTASTPALFKPSPSIWTTGSMPFASIHLSPPPRAHLASSCSPSLSVEGERHCRSPRRRGRLSLPAGLLLLSSVHLHDPLASHDLAHPFFVSRSSSSHRHCRSLRGRTLTTSASTRAHQPLHAARSEPDHFLNASASDLPLTSRRRPTVSLASPQTLASSPAMPCVHARVRKKDAAPSDLDRTVAYHFNRPGPEQAARSGPAQVWSRYIFFKQFSLFIIFCKIQKFIEYSLYEQIEWFKFLCVACYYTFQIA
jgi:hypothetical protein